MSCATRTTDTTEREHRRQANRAVAVSAVGLGLAGLAELLLALFTGSVALLGDALHNLSDVSTSAVVFLGFKVSERPTSKKFPYGLERAEDLAGLGVALVIWASAEVLSLDKSGGDSATTWLTQLGLGGGGLVMLAGVVTIRVKSLLAADQAVLLLSFAFIPVATAVNISPWLVAVAILALGLSWHVPAQSPEYLVAYGATHGRLYSHGQGRRMAFGYEAIALAGLAVCLPYWHLLDYI